MEAAAGLALLLGSDAPSEMHEAWPVGLHHDVTGSEVRWADRGTSIAAGAAAAIACS